MSIVLLCTLMVCMVYDSCEVKESRYLTLVIHEWSTINSMVEMHYVPAPVVWKMTSTVEIKRALSDWGLDGI